MARPDWDEYMLGMAEAASKRGECTRRLVGAAIFGPDHRIVQTGYNGAPAGKPSCLDGYCPRGRFTHEELPGFVQGNHDYETGTSLCIAVHAEVNAIGLAGFAACRRGTIAITLQPCHNCALLIEAAGIVRAIWPGGEITFLIPEGR